MRRWIILFSVGIFIVLANLDMTIVNLALPELSKNFLATIQQAQLMIVSYLTAAALFFCFSGKLADCYGKKKIFLLGSFVFVMASFFLGGVIHTINLMIIFRFIQGIGFATTLSLAVVLIVQAFPVEKKGLAAGMAVTLSGIGLALGPPVGGFILQYIGWRWIFLMNVPLGILSMLFVYLFVVEDPKSSDKIFKLDRVGALFYFFGILSLIYLLNASHQLEKKETVLLSFFSLLSLTVFIYRSLTASYPLINVVLLKNSRYLIILLVRVIFMFVMASFLFILPLYMQNILNYSRMDSGLLLLCMTGAIFLVSPFAGTIVDRWSYQWPIVISIVLLVLSCIFFLYLNGCFSMGALFLGFISFGLSNGVHTTSTINGALSNVEPEFSGAAVGLFFTVAIIGSMMGVTFSGWIVNHVSHYELTHAIFAPHHFSSEQWKILNSVANGSQSLWVWNGLFPGIAVASLKKITTHSFFVGLHALMRFDFFFSAIGFMLSLLLLRGKCKKTTQSGRGRA